MIDFILKIIFKFYVYSHIAEDLIPNYKYPIKKQIKEASLRILTKFQSEKIKLIMASNEWDSLFENGILSAVNLFIKWFLFFAKYLLY